MVALALATLVLMAASQLLLRTHAFSEHALMMARVQQTYAQLDYLLYTELRGANRVWISQHPSEAVGSCLVFYVANQLHGMRLRQRQLQRLLTASSATKACDSGSWQSLTEQVQSRVTQFQAQLVGAQLLELRFAVNTHKAWRTRVEVAYFANH